MDKAQSLSVSTLVIIALGLIVLVVGTMLIVRYTDDSALESCTNRNGICQASCSVTQPSLGPSDCPEPQECCLRDLSGGSG